MKTYAKTSLGEKQRVANYQISRARRQIENVFGICASRFRIFRRPIIGNADTVTYITKAVVAIHNYLMAGRTFGNDYCPVDYAETGWREEQLDSQGLCPLSRQGTNNYTKDAGIIHNEFADYFINVGSVPWQWEHITRTSHPFDTISVQNVSVRQR